jgi:hypothetical protein
MSAYAFAETCVFGKQSLEPICCGPLTRLTMTASALLGHPFFQRYGVNLPSSLTEGVSFTWGAFSLPTGVGMRYGQSRRWLAAFLGGVGASDFRPLAQTRPSRHAKCRAALPTRRTPGWKPSLSIRWAHLPYRVPASLVTRHSGAGLSHLLSIAYDVMSSA